jgi:RNA polymerase sigma-70 factor (ECF subfamily)
MPTRDMPASATQDAEALLVQRAKERSPSAWAEIYDNSYPKLFRYCYARTGDTAVAADLASTVFLEAVERIDRFTYRGRPLLAWLYRIARNKVSDHLTSRGREAKALETAGSLLDRHEASPASRVGDQIDLLHALRSLTGDQQQVIALRYYAAFTTAEIAEALERSERAIYSLEVRALAALRRVLDPESGEAVTKGPTLAGKLRRLRPISIMRRRDEP